MKGTVLEIAKNNALLIGRFIVTLSLLLSSSFIRSCHAFVRVPTTTTTTTTSFDWSVSSVKQKYMNDDDYKKNKNGDVSRRSLLFGGSIGMAVSSSLVFIPTETVFASQTAGEAIRRSAANLPGYGQADVFFPPTFVGKWTVTRTILNADPSYIDAKEYGSGTYQLESI